MSSINNRQDYFVSVISVIRNKAPILENYLKNLHNLLEQTFSDYEIILIDQCSNDDTTKLIDRLLIEIPSVRFIELNQIVHQDIALAAGLENSIGDFAILLSPERDPIDCIPDLVNMCRDGYDIIIGTSKSRKTLGYRIVRPCIQFLLKWIGYELPKNATPLRCLSRRCINTVTQIGRFHHQFFVRISKTGYPSTSYKYTQNLTYSQKQSLFNGLLQTCRLLIFNSTKPLRWMSMMGFGGSFLAFLITLYSLVIHLFKTKVVEGWTSMVLFMSTMFMLLFSILAFFGEYLGRVLDNSGDHQDYSIVYEKNSSVMLNEQRYNVLKESTSKQINKVQTGRNG